MIRYPTLQNIFGDTLLSFRSLRTVTSEMVEARNVDNVQEIEQYIDTLIPLADGKPEVEKWLDSNLRNYMIRDTEEVEPVKEVPDAAPGWLEKAIQEGKEVFHVVITDQFKDKIQHAMDYLKSSDAPPKLDRVTVPEAIKQSEAWTKKLNKIKVDRAAAEAGEVIVKDYDDGYSWRKLTSKDALAREGTMMGHCSANYYDRVHSGDVEIWSLRDAKNEPHCTMELRPASKYVQQIKGKQNKEVIEKYRTYIRDILNDDHLHGWEIAKTEIKNADLFFRFNKWWTDDSQFAEDPVVFGELVKKFFGDWNRFQTPPHPDGDGGPGCRGAFCTFSLEDFLDYMDTEVPKDARISTKTYRALLAYDPEIGEDPNGLLPEGSPAVREGWKIGTQKAAREYALENLSQIRWDGGSRTEENDQNIGLVVSWNALEDGYLAEISSGRNPKKGGWEATYDQQAAEKFLVNE